MDSNDKKIPIEKQKSQTYASGQYSLHDGVSAEFPKKDFDDSFVFSDILVPISFYSGAYQPMVYLRSVNKEWCLRMIARDYLNLLLESSLIGGTISGTFTFYKSGRTYLTKIVK